MRRHRPRSGVSRRPLLSPGVHVATRHKPKKPSHRQRSPPAGSRRPLESRQAEDNLCTIPRATVRWQADHADRDGRRDEPEAQGIGAGGDKPILPRWAPASTGKSDRPKTWNIHPPARVFCCAGVGTPAPSLWKMSILCNRGCPPATYLMCWQRGWQTSLSRARQGVSGIEAKQTH